MSDLFSLIKSACSDDTLEQYSDEKLRELIKLLPELEKTAKIVIADRKVVEDDSGEEFIEIVINGKADLIKKDIQVLNISCNDFKTLPKAIYRLKNLKKLYLFNNKFSLEEKKKIRKSFPQKVQIHF